MLKLESHAAFRGDLAQQGGDGEGEVRAGDQEKVTSSQSQKTQENEGRVPGVGKGTSQAGGAAQLPGGRRTWRM